MKTIAAHIKTFFPGTTLLAAFFLLMSKGVFGQQGEIEKSLYFTNETGVTEVKIMVGYEVKIWFKKPELTMSGIVLSFNESSLVIAIEGGPRKQIVPVENIKKLLVSRRLERATEKPDSTVLVQVETADGNSYLGKVLYEDGEKIILKTQNVGEITFKMVDVVKVTQIRNSQLVEGVYFFENPQATRYFFSPNGFGLKRGEAYYQNVWVLFNQFSVGVTDNFSIGGGLIPLFLFGGASTPVWLTPKFSIPVKKDRVSLGVGGLLTTVIGEKSSGAGVVYGMSTFGNRDKNFTIGLGLGYSSGKLADRPTVSFSALIRTGARSYFVTENYYINSSSGSLGLLSVGGRKIINRAGLDFGLFLPIASGITTIVVIPWLGITARLDRPRR